MDELEVVRTLAALVAAGSVVLAAISLRTSREQARTAFEDALAREYREIAGTLPPAAFYAEQRATLGDSEMQAMFRYFDLSNEQLRLIEEGRIRNETGAVWKAGIVGLLRFETFGAAWRKLHPELPADFYTSLDRLVREHSVLDESAPQDAPGVT